MSGDKSKLRKYIGDLDPNSELLPDESANREQFYFGKDVDYDKDTKRLKNERYEKNTLLRHDLAVIFSVIIFLWLLCAIITLWNNQIFNLSDSVLITLLTTTTVQVLGMMAIILKDLFPGLKR